MQPKAIVGLVRSRIAYIKDWGDAAINEAEVSQADGAPERVFDLSEILHEGNSEVEIASDLTTLGRHLPFPLFAMVGTGHGVVIVSGDDSGFYAYCYSAPVAMLFVHFTPIGWSYVGFRRQDSEAPERVSGDDPSVRQLAEAVAMMLTLVTKACDDTKHMVSYTLTRAERRQATRGISPDTLGATIVHHVCLNSRAKDALVSRRGATVVHTPKRLHEVRAHWRQLRSGVLTRVRAHARGQRGGTLLPRIYTATRPLAAVSFSQGAK